MHGHQVPIAKNESTRHITSPIYLCVNSIANSFRLGILVDYCNEGRLSSLLQQNNEDLPYLLLVPIKVVQLLSVHSL